MSDHTHTHTPIALLTSLSPAVTLWDVRHQGTREARLASAGTALTSSWWQMALRGRGRGWSLCSSKEQSFRNLYKSQAFFTFQHPVQCPLAPGCFFHVFI